HQILPITLVAGCVESIEVDLLLLTALAEMLLTPYDMFSASCFCFHHGLPVGGISPIALLIADLYIALVSACNLYRDIAYSPSVIFPNFHTSFNLVTLGL